MNITGKACRRTTVCMLSMRVQSIVPVCIALGKMSGGHYLPTGPKSFLRGTQTFWTMSNSLTMSNTFFQGGRTGLPSKQRDCLWTSRRNVCVSPRSQISSQPS